MIYVIPNGHSLQTSNRLLFVYMIPGKHRVSSSNPLRKRSNVFLSHSSIPWSTETPLTSSWNEPCTGMCAKSLIGNWLLPLGWTTYYYVMRGSPQGPFQSSPKPSTHTIQQYMQYGHAEKVYVNQQQCDHKLVWLSERENMARFPIRENQPHKNCNASQHTMLTHVE